MSIYSCQQHVCRQIRKIIIKGLRYSLVANLWLKLIYLRHIRYSGVSIGLKIVTLNSNGFLIYFYDVNTIFEQFFVTFTKKRRIKFYFFFHYFIFLRLVDSLYVILMITILDNVYTKISNCI